MTIGALAESVERTHSAMSQKVAAMRTAGLVRTSAGADARAKTVTEPGRRRHPRGTGPQSFHDRIAEKRDDTWASSAINSASSSAAG
jgi:hypothetical protein